MDNDDNVYLIWSHEHGAWWGPGGHSYVGKVSAAGRYTRQKAIDVCAKAMPGTSDRMGRLPELPVRLSDVQTVIGDFATRYPNFRMDKASWL